MGRRPIFFLWKNTLHTVSYNPVPQAGRLSVGRVRSQVTNIHCLLQEPVDHFAHIPYTGLALVFSSQIKLKAKRRVGNPFGEVYSSFLVHAILQRALVFVSVYYMA